MARFGGNKKSQRVNKRPLYTRIKGRQNARRRPLLPGKGVTQASYEAGFFDFLKVFWNHNRGMELRSLTKQVANAWEALLPKPRLSKRRVLKDYSKEFKQLQKEIERQKLEEENERKKQREEENGSGTEASSKSNFDDSEGSIGSTNATSDNEEDENQSQTDDDSYSETNRDSESELESDESTERSSKRKRNGRRYESYEDYLNAHGKKLKPDTNDQNNEDNNAEKTSEGDKNASSDQNKQENSNNGNPKDGVFFPVREMTSFDRIVTSEFDDQNEMLRKLKLHGSTTDPDVPDDDDSRGVQSVDSFTSPLAGPKFLPKSSSNSIAAKLSSPTDTLHVKNLVVGIRQPDLQEIFRVFLNDIVLIRVLDNKYNGEAVVEFKTVEAAEKVWRQMNGVEYKRLPLVLEFANKEDLIY